MFQTYLENEQFNFQMNRFLEPYYEDSAIQETVRRAAAQIVDTESWYETWTALAGQADSDHRYGLAASYYQLADFYLSEDDPRKRAVYGEFRANFYQTVDRSELEFSAVPYEGKALPCVRVSRHGAEKTLLFHGGFDSRLEELISFSKQLDALKEYNFIMFEGPGQGEAVRAGLALTPQWEKPVRAVLDYYRLERADLLGMSLGGYLCLRAAAFEPRIESVVAYDIMYSAFDSLTMKMDASGKQLLGGINTEAGAVLIDKIFTKKAETDVNLAFKLKKTYDITHTDRPSEMIKAVMQYTLDGIEDRITQDVLLLAGTHDQFVPFERYSLLKQRLVNAHSVTGEVFDERTGGEQHCQIGRKQLAYDAIIRFLQRK